MLKYAVIAALGLLLGMADKYAFAADLARTETFVYSNLCWEDNEGGDGSGVRLRLVRSATGEEVEFEWSEGGGPAGPIKATEVSFDSATSELRFAVPAPFITPTTYRISGKVSNQAFVFETWDWGDGQGAGAAKGIVPRVKGDKRNPTRTWGASKRTR